MMFVSRYVWPDKYGIVDTDDGVEEILAYVQLYNAISTIGNNIAGVEARLMEYEDGLGNLYFIDSIKPYQDINTVTQLQTKTKVIYNTEVVTYGKTITAIRFKQENITRPVTLRLSDYGLQLADCIFSGGDKAGRHIATLILDDKLSFDYRSLSMITNTRTNSVGINGLGVVLDLRELSNDSLARRVYRTFNCSSQAELKGSIIDRPERKDVLLP